MTCAAVALVPIHNRYQQARRQREAVRQLGEFRGGAYYAYQLNGAGEPIHMADPPGPRWLRSLVGIDFLSRVKGITFWEWDGPPAKAYSAFRDLPYLETVMFFDAAFTGDGAHHLAQLPRLNRLIVNQQGLSESDLAGIGQLQQLETLILCQTQFDEKALLNLRPLKKLKILDLRHTNWEPAYPNISQSTIDQLKGALPGCEIIL